MRFLSSQIVYYAKFALSFDKIGCISGIKIKLSKILFSIPQNLHYLCPRKVKLSDILLMDVNVIDDIRQYFSTQPVKKAWLFGSFSREEETPMSDVDILVEFDRSGKPVTLLTYARMWRELEERLGRNVDLVEEGTLKPYAIESANRDKRLIYERKN